MTSKNSLDLEAANRLREAGYLFVQVAPHLPSRGGVAAHVLAWGANDNGELVPQVAVVVKQSGRPEISLPQLSRIQDALGTTEHYVVIGEDWHVGEPGLRRLKPVERPEASVRAEGVISDATLATDLLIQKVWAFADKNRGRTEADIRLFLEALSTEVENPGITTISGDFVPVERETLWAALRKVFAEYVMRTGMRTGMHATPPVIARAIAELLGDRLTGTVLDPFCGSGEILWATIDRAVAEDRDINVIGSDISADISDLAHLFGSNAPRQARIQTKDAFRDTLPSADAVVSVPPFGLRLQQPHTLINGTSTKNADMAAIDLCLRALKAGGRAVFQISPGLTYRSDAEDFRKYLANEFRIAALIGCPSGAAFGTQIKTVLMVVDKAPAGETFVAQLGEDWEIQLSTQGAVLSAAIAHIDGLKN